ncbi:sorting nexin lst-4 [Neodiprion pinetum]|uniref:sorting nexin lst-4 n=1 Tax=Neodiprion fabricii TaxID=2872261 RepID=UPI001ED93646|nr:sorting nexin lst-4 [Neodiprion fabricii]XP_046425559.1 sorting nexin lst-4 [Neodiprion fabricii]XP_046482064.1 sorting nexin lst-4 [Neodiprion pinetum]XP_046482065.1 sorting nexin lst-4 [Neodiprion pinetum]XP_046619290.1 sorting nexin lst-4 [Neodiprion virginianus]XP_046619291.1 sorting nexin lst-4 [Neodiprion virginianus]
MEGHQVQALYDFTGEPGTAELSINAGQILTVIRANVGDGWCEGVNQSGKSGLFPAAYVQPVDPNASAPPMTGSTTSSQQGTGDYWDDDWDDDSEAGHDTPAPVNQQQHHPQQAVQPSSQPVYPDYADSISTHTVHSVISERPISNVPKKNTKFSTLIKSGEDSFLMGTKIVVVPDNERVFIEENEERRCVWVPAIDTYNCVVTSPKKESKLKGLKSFIVYQLTPTFNNIQVSRRYKHFDWLHERLEEKYCFIPIPPLPDKQISGRYEEQFIEHRRTQLQEFVDYVCRHPVLCRSRVWEHFMTCTDEKRWKAGKRQAEKDELLGVNYFNVLQCPDTPLDPVKVDIENDAFAKFINGLDPVVKNFMAMAVDQSKKHQVLYKREFQKIAQSFTSLGFALDADDNSRGILNSALKVTGDAYNEIGKLYEEQPKFDWEPLGDKFHIYRGIISSFPDVISIHKSAVQKRKDSERLVSEHKMEPQQLRELSHRTDVIARALMAEETHFQMEREVHIKQAMKNHLTEQIAFYKKIVNKLQEALNAYDG